jgi:spore coat protein SA
LTDMTSIYHLLTESEPFSEYNGGAISRWVANVVRFDIDAIVLAPSSDNSWGFNPQRIRNIPRLSAHKRFLDKGGHYLPWVIRLGALRNIICPALELLKSGDVVWVHGRPEFAAALEPFVHKRGAKLFLHLHNSHLVQWSTRVIKAIHADCYVFNSRFLKEEALAEFPSLGRTAILVNGADQEMFHPAGNDKLPGVPTVLFASRLVPDKGLHIFLDAMRCLAEQGVALRGIVVGSSGFGGSQPTQYVLDMKAKAPPNVDFEPYCTGPQLANRFRHSDIYCLPACWHDPFPLTVLEAMASGIPVVASRSGGIPDQLREGGGLLVARNSVPELAVALAQLAGNPEMRRELGAHGLASFRRNFTWESIRSGYRTILQVSTPVPLNIADAVKFRQA